VFERFQTTQFPPKIPIRDAALRMPLNLHL
jgi:hypothetical protein